MQKHFTTIMAAAYPEDPEEGCYTVLITSIADGITINDLQSEITAGMETERDLEDLYYPLYPQIKKSKVNAALAVFSSQEAAETAVRKMETKWEPRQIFFFEVFDNAWIELNSRLKKTLHKTKDKIKMTHSSHGANMQEIIKENKNDYKYRTGSWKEIFKINCQLNRNNLLFENLHSELKPTVGSQDIDAREYYSEQNLLETSYPTRKFRHSTGSLNMSSDISSNYMQEKQIRMKQSKNNLDQSADSGVSMRVYVHDITKVKVDVIVNAANEYMQHTGGVAAAISKAAGSSLQKECADIVSSQGQVATGDVIVTTGGNLPCRYVIHAVGPRWTDYKDKDECGEILTKAYRQCLEVANKRSFSSIAVPAIGNGIFGIPKATVAQCVYKSISSFFEPNINKVCNIKTIHIVDMDKKIVNMIKDNIRSSKMFKETGKNGNYRMVVDKKLSDNTEVCHNPNSTLSLLSSKKSSKPKTSNPAHKQKGQKQKKAPKPEECLLCEKAFSCTTVEIAAKHQEEFDRKKFKDFLKKEKLIIKIKEIDGKLQLTGSCDQLIKANIELGSRLATQPGRTNDVEDKGGSYSITNVDTADIYEKFRKSEEDSILKLEKEFEVKLTDEVKVGKINFTIRGDVEQKVQDAENHILNLYQKYHYASKNERKKTDKSLAAAGTASVKQVTSNDDNVVLFHKAQSDDVGKKSKPPNAKHDEVTSRHSTAGKQQTNATLQNSLLTGDSINVVNMKSHTITNLGSFPSTFPNTRFQYETQSGMNLFIYEGDITEVTVDVIVNAANARMDHGTSGVSGAIAKAAGSELKDECLQQVKDKGEIKVGDCIMTTGGNLPCKCVIHAVGPQWDNYQNKMDCRVCLQDTYKKCLETAGKEWETVAIPAISGGNYGVPIIDVAEAMYQAVTDYCKPSNKPKLRDIHLVDKNKEMVQAVNEQFLNGQIEFKVVPNYKTNSDSQVRLAQSIDSHDYMNCNEIGNHTTMYNTRNDIDYKNVAFSTCQRNGTHMGKYRDEVDSAVAFSPLSPGLSAAADVRKTATSAQCVICLDVMKKPKQLECKHVFCTDCIDRQFKTKPVCPICGKAYGIITGDQPKDGKMYVWRTHHHLPGYPTSGTIKITYNIPDGFQTDDHPNPGRPYSGTVRLAYLPDNDEGNKVLDLLKKAFDARLIFTIGHSHTQGTDGTIVWNDIHHKTSTHGGVTSYGYPDPGYLDRVQVELALKGVTYQPVSTHVSAESTHL